MGLEVVTLCGAVVTEGAGIGLLAGVYPLVPSQVGAVSGLVVAMITDQLESFLQRYSSSLGRHCQYPF